MEREKKNCASNRVQSHEFEICTRTQSNRQKNSIEEKKPQNNRLCECIYIFRHYVVCAVRVVVCVNLSIPLKIEFLCVLSVDDTENRIQSFKIGATKNSMV